MSDQPKTIELALQGGGAHGAFAWGVVDRLLADNRLRIEGVSGTSAGAMNAVAMADGMAKGGSDGARRALREFWRKVSDAGRFSPIQRTPLDMLLGRWSLDFSPGYIVADLATRMLSPYQINPFNVNPLADMIASLIDFDAVNRCDCLKVFITATDVETGRATVFRQPDLRPESLMASACLPFLFQAVEIDGRHYWDGGYMGNPSLFPLVDECGARDMVLVRVNPFHRAGPPTTAQEILNRLNEINFNASLINELRAIALLRDLIEAEGLEHERYRSMRVHSISADEEMAHLRVSSKMNAEWAFLLHLHDIGWNAAGAWLERNFERIGTESTFDLESVFEGGFRPLTKPAPRVPPDEPQR